MIDPTQPLRDHFIDVFLAKYPDLQVTYNNAPPKDFDQTKLYCWFKVIPGQIMPRAADFWEQLGSVAIRIIVPKGQGDGEANALAMDFAMTFMAWRSSDDNLRSFQSSINSSTLNDELTIDAVVLWEHFFDTQ